MLKKAITIILALGVFCIPFVGMVSAQEYVYDEPVVEFYKLSEPRNLAGAAVPSTVMMNTFVMTVADFEDQICSSQYDVPTNTPIVWGAYLYLTSVDPIYVKFKLSVTGPETKNWTSWYPDALDAGYYLAIVKNGRHSKAGIYSASLVLTPENGTASSYTKEYSKYEVVDE